MQKVRPAYAFDVEGHTVVTTEPKKEQKAKTPEWLSQALNESDWVYIIYELEVCK